MSEATDHTLLEVLLDSWDRNNAILANFLRILPSGGLDARAIETSPSIAQMFNHIHYVRLVFVAEDAPEFAIPVPEEEWGNEQDIDRLTGMLNESAKVVRDAVRSRVESGGAMNMHYDHPILMLQHMIWHEGYHHGQMKLALKAAGLTVPNEVAGPATWRVWMRKTSRHAVR
ncbi:MAG: DinB family protein [Chthoniobacterales bacterium]